MPACQGEFQSQHALLSEGISLIRETIIWKRFPMTAEDPTAFKPIWQERVDAINHACGKIRGKREEHFLASS